MKKLLIILLIGITTLQGYSQTTPASFKDDPFNHPMFPVYLAFALFVVMVVLVCIVISYVVRILNIFTTQAEKAKAEELGQAYVPRLSWWDKFTQTMNASVAVANESEIELNHSYDGIKELDNHLPPWWKYLFYGTIGWAVVYIVVFHIANTLPLQTDEYQQELAIAEDQAQRFKASQPQEEIDVDKLSYTADVKLIEQGKAVFMDNNCGACHRNDAGGNTIGPNLTDNYWLHGGTIQQVFSTVKNGVIDKGMPAWGKSLTPQKVRDVTFFIMSLQGSNPANAKAPQGERFEKEVARDSVSTAAL
jgi:cytochrome c oxidase cbb3-type subunit III